MPWTHQYRTRAGVQAFCGTDSENCLQTHPSRGAQWTIPWGERSKHRTSVAQTLYWIVQSHRQVQPSRCPSLWPRHWLSLSRLRGWPISGQMVDRWWNQSLQRRTQGLYHQSCIILFKRFQLASITIDHERYRTLAESGIGQRSENVLKGLCPQQWGHVLHVQVAQWQTSCSLTGWILQARNRRRPKMMRKSGNSDHAFSDKKPNGHFCHSLIRLSVLKG